MRLRYRHKWTVFFSLSSVSRILVALAFARFEIVGSIFILLLLLWLVWIVSFPENMCDAYVFLMCLVILCQQTCHTHIAHRIIITIVWMHKNKLCIPCICLSSYPACISFSPPFRFHSRKRSSSRCKSLPHTEDSNKNHCMK